MEEFALAARMEAAACRSAAMLHLARAGTADGSDLLTGYGRDIGDIVPDFKRIWRLRNRRSRLADDVLALRRSVGQYRRLEA